MRDTFDRAFKEWAAVVQAMEAGRTILVIRKGGITEEGGAFRVQDPEFALFPNHTHQNAAQLKPSALDLLAASEASKPDEGIVRITSVAEVAATFVVPDEAALARLDPLHPWAPDYMRERLLYKPAQPLYALALRVSILPEPVEMVYLASYGGCTSWVTLDEPVDARGAVPAVDDAAFARELERLRAALGASE